MAERALFVRPLTAADQDLIWQLLSYAAHEPSVEATKSQTCCIPYAQDFGTRRGDFGIVIMTKDHHAHDNQVHEEYIVGGAWIRLLGTHGMSAVVVDKDDDDPKEIPELALAVIPDYRGQGIGSTLLTEFLKLAKQNGTFEICLSCRIDNQAAMKLYKRHGFQTIHNSEKTNRVGGISVSMLVKLR